jgi:hypothetical protein
MSIPLSLRRLVIQRSEDRFESRSAHQVLSQTRSELLNTFNLVDANPPEPNSIELLSTVYNECIQC